MIAKKVIVKKGAQSSKMDCSGTEEGEEEKSDKLQSLQRNENTPHPLIDGQSIYWIYLFVHLESDVGVVLCAYTVHRDFDSCP